MDSPTVTETRATLAETYRRTELDICKALIEHYVQITNDSKEALKQVMRTIQKKLKQKGPEASMMYKAFLNRLERSKDNFRSLLQERRGNNLLRLTSQIHTSFQRSHTHDQTSHAHTHTPQASTPRRKTLGQYPGKLSKGEGPKRDSNIYMPYQ